MYLRLIDKQGFVSPIMYIHCDEEEFLAEIYKWRDGLWAWLEEDKTRDVMPLGRLDAGTCMFDLIRYLGEYYIKSTPNCDGRVWATLKLEDEPKKKENRVDLEKAEVIVEIKTYKEEEKSQ